ncbi:unnamed protein product, partial [marine sediment metagenome]
VSFVLALTWVVDICNEFNEGDYANTSCTDGSCVLDEIPLGNALKHSYSSVYQEYIDRLGIKKDKSLFLRRINK